MATIQLAITLYLEMCCAYRPFILNEQELHWLQRRCLPKPWFNSHPKVAMNYALILLKGICRQGSWPSLSAVCLSTLFERELLCTSTKAEHENEDGVWHDDG